MEQYIIILLILLSGIYIVRKLRKQGASGCCKCAGCKESCTRRPDKA